MNMVMSAINCNRFTFLTFYYTVNVLMNINPLLNH